MNEPKADTGAISDFTSNAYDKVSDGIDSLKNTVSSSVADYSSQSSTNLGEASKEFLQSNGIIAKVVFVFFVIIMFNIILRLGMFLITYLSTNDPNPYLIEGLIQGSQGLQVKQDPKDSDSVTVLRSNNQTTGIEFSWSVWLFINDLGKVTEGSPNYSHIFHKGINSVSSTGIANINNAPGVYLGTNTDPTLHIVMDTIVPNAPIVIDINNIPLKKWFHLLIRLQNTSMDVYINGVVTSHVIFDNVPKQNYQDVFLCLNGGFNGSLSNLRYFSHALDIFKITGLVTRGPNLAPSKSPAVSSANPGSSYKSGFSYLANLWYMNKF